MRWLQDITRVCLNLFGSGFYASTKCQKEGGGSKFKPTLSRQSRNQRGDSIVRRC